MNINDQLNQAQKEYLGERTNYFLFEKGENRIRILTEGEPVATHFFGPGKKASTCYGRDKGCPFHDEKAPKDDKGDPKKPSIKFTCYVQSGEEVLLADLPFSVIKQVGDFQQHIDYQFSEFPMPYDITVKFDPDAAPNDKYKVVPARQNTPISENVDTALKVAMGKLTPIQNVQKKKDYTMNQHKEQGIWISPEQLAKKRQEWVEKVNSENEGKTVEPVIQYPKDEINPEDIPF